MAKKSAGILVYKLEKNSLFVLLAHPGGPFWAKKDKGAWSIPKGEFEDEEPKTAAIREYKEELGCPPPSGDLLELGNVKMKSGKTIYAWAVEGEFKESSLKSNEFELEWPPKSGQVKKYPEVDRVRWFDAQTAKIKINQAQAEFINVLVSKLDINLPKEKEQTSLF